MTLGQIKLIRKRAEEIYTQWSMFPNSVIVDQKWEVTIRPVHGTTPNYLQMKELLRFLGGARAEIVELCLLLEKELTK